LCEHFLFADTFTAYQYDQLNRLKVAQLSTSFNSTNNTWNSSHTATNAYLENEIEGSPENSYV
jgi:hypothetical protein